jgi:6-phosphofructokinase 1
VEAKRRLALKTSPGGVIIRPGVRARQEVPVKIAVLTAGGVAPGMNAAVRAVAQAAFSRDWEVVGIEGGFEGILEERFQDVDGSQLAGLMHRGGTVLGSGRSKEVRETEGQERAARMLDEAGVGGLVVIGGGGSLTSAKALGEAGVKAVGIPATIDNDVSGTELALGVDSAIETAVGAIDRIRGTTISHNRGHIVKVMGSDSGYLALMSAIAGGAEVVVLPEFETKPEDILRFLEEAYERGKSHFIIVAAEGAGLSAEELQEYINDAEGTYEADITAVGHIQSGGDPTSADRILAARLGAAAVEALADGEPGVMVGVSGEEVRRVPLEEVVGEQRPLNPDLYELAKMLAEMPE